MRSNFHHYSSSGKSLLIDIYACVKKVARQEFFPFQDKYPKWSPQNTPPNPQKSPRVFKVILHCELTSATRLALVLIRCRHSQGNWRIDASVQGLCALPARPKAHLDTVRSCRYAPTLRILYTEWNHTASSASTLPCNIRIHTPYLDHLHLQPPLPQHHQHSRLRKGVVMMKKRRRKRKMMTMRKEMAHQAIEEYRQ